MEAAVYCLKGHYIGLSNEVIRGRSWHDTKILLENPREPQQLPRFCTKCGAMNISGCQHCQTTIEAQYPGVIPAYCGTCGKPFPWTETALSAAKAYTDEQEALNAEEKLALKGTFDDLTSDTARTPVAATRFNKLIMKIGPAAGDALKQIMVTVATATAKKYMGLP
ncbi:MAG: DUF2321 domain-containing protein [Bryobacteraceae bacterium]|jgi:hypothetical protein